MPPARAGLAAPQTGGTRSDCHSPQQRLRFIPPGNESGIVRPINTIPEKHVAKPNYQYEKRQRELEKKKKKEEKAQRKAAGHDTPAAEAQPGDAPMDQPAQPPATE